MILALENESVYTGQGAIIDAVVLIEEEKNGWSVVCGLTCKAGGDEWQTIGDDWLFWVLVPTVEGSTNSSDVVIEARRK